MFYILVGSFSKCLQVVQVVLVVSVCLQPFIVGFLLMQVVPGCVQLVWEVLVCLSWFDFFVFQYVEKLSFERLRWFGSAPACCGMLQFVCKRGRSDFVRLFGFALFWGRSGRFRMFGVVLGCLGSIPIFSLYSVVWICYFAFRCFHLFHDFFYVAFGCFVNCCFLSRSIGVVLHCFESFFGRFNFLWKVFGFRDCFRLILLVSGVQVCVVCFSLSWVVVGWSGWFLVVVGSWMLHRFFGMFSHLQVVLSW